MKPETSKQILTLVSRNYQEIAPAFHTSRQKLLWPAMQRLAREVKLGERVLDAGCGNGRLVDALPGKELEYLGIDSSPSLIELAKRNHPGWAFQVADLLDLDKDLGIFDHIFCLAVLQHIPSQPLRQQVIRELASHLGLGGRLILSNWNLWASHHRGLIFRHNLRKLLVGDRLDFNDIIFPWKDETGQAISQRYYHAFSFKELDRLVAKTGLQITERFKDRHNYWYVLKK